MRGDLHHDTLQNDSSSGSSSPHSNTSHEEGIDETSDQILPQKVVYNFSIPEFINHEPRIDRDDRAHMESVRRKRNRVQRQQSSESRDLRERDDIIEAPVIVQNTKRRRRAAAQAVVRAAAASQLEDDDGDCHHRNLRRNVPIIDLTDDSHDDFTHAHSDSEQIREERSSIFRPFRPRDHDAASYSDILSDIERHRLQRSERHNERLSRLYLGRSPSLQRLHRIQQRRRNEAYRQSTRQIITDGPRFTEDMLMRTVEGNNRTGETSNEPCEEDDADDSVLVVNEIRGDSPDNDRAIAQRMQNDPTYSPPYYTPPNQSHSRLNGSSFQLIQERFRAMRQRRDVPPSTSSSHQLRHLFSRDRSSDLTAPNLERMESLRSRSSTHERNNDPTPQVNDNQDEDSNATTTARMNAADEAAANSDDGDGEVEFIGEWNSTNNSDNPIRGNQFPTLVPYSLHNPIYPFPFPPPNSDLFVPALTRLLPTPPRLHHIYQENYEALLNLAETLGPGKPRGLEKSEIDRIPSFRFSSNTAKETNSKCVVCISEYSNREKLRRLPCSHDFHAKCIDKWLKSNKTCPVCRDEVKVASTE